MKKIKYHRCYYCNSNQVLSAFVIKNYMIVQCVKCGLIYTNLTIHHNIQNFNIEHYSDIYLHSYQARKEKLFSRFSERVAEIESIKNGGKILDVGCSTGMFLDIMQYTARNRWQYYGIDINKRSIDYAKKYFQFGTFTVSSVSEFHAKPGTMDVITCFDVLEHDPLLPKSLQAIYRLLKPGGFLIVQSPNYKSIMAKLCGDNWDWWSLPDHIIHFDPKTLADVLIENNFRIHDMRTWDPAEDFLSNIRGTLKLKLPKIFMINKVVSKIAVPFIHLQHQVLELMEPYFHSGGLIRIIAHKI